MKKLERLKKKYREYCIEKGEPDTYRGLLGWLEDNGLEIGYIEGLQLGLMDFNNDIFEELMEDG